MNAQVLFDAVGGIDERYLAEAEALRPTPQKKRWLRAALVAALLAGLFGVTAYAAGWFGLGNRVTASRDLCLNGFLDSREARAYSEWTEYRDAYADGFLAAQGSEPFDMDWAEESPEFHSAAALYGALDRSSAKTLLELAARYGMTIHTRALQFSSSKNFLRAAGVAPFAGDSAEYSGLVYEDGSYTAEFTVPVGEDTEKLSLYRYFTGVLQPTGLERTLVKPENYLEWSFRNAYGQGLSLALSVTDEALFAIGNELIQRDDNQLFSFYIFYSQEGQYLTAAGNLHLRRLHGFDEAAARSQLEALADRIDFQAAAGMDCDTAYYLDYAPVSASADGKPDLAAFLSLPEAQASLVMQRELSRDTGLTIGRGMEEAVHGGGELDILRNGSPIPASKIDALFEALADEYGLQYPSECHSLRGSGLSTEQFSAQAGQGDFGGEIRCLLDNGVFWGFDADRNSFLFLPRGSFLAAWQLYALPEAAGQPGWFYENQNGDKVYLCRTTHDPKLGYLLYESEGGWFLMLVDNPELWQLEEAADRLRLSELN